MLEITNGYSASIDALLYTGPKCSELSACCSVCGRGRVCWLKRTAGAKIFFYLLSIEEPTWPDAKIFWNWAPATALSTGAWTLSLLFWHRPKPTLWPVYTHTCGMFELNFGTNNFQDRFDPRQSKSNIWECFAYRGGVPSVKPNRLGVFGFTS